MLHICCYCGCLMTEAGIKIRDLRPLERATLDALASHGYCIHCSEVIRQDIINWIRTADIAQENLAKRAADLTEFAAKFPARDDIKAAILSATQRTKPQPIHAGVCCVCSCVYDDKGLRVIPLDEDRAARVTKHGMCKTCVTAETKATAVRKARQDKRASGMEQKGDWK